MNVYIARNYRETKSASNKAKSDIDHLLQANGWRNIGLPRTRKSNLLLHFTLNLIGIVKAAVQIRRGDNLLIQYPLNKYYSFITWVAHLRGAKTIVLIHDLSSFRVQKVKRELELLRLSKADYIIASNSYMAKMLRRLGLKQAKGSLEAWDYLTKTDPIPSRIKENETRIVYAGMYDREKNGFIWEWGNAINRYVVDIYGRGFRKDQVAHPERFYNHGFVGTEDMIAGMTSDFGLVWDGDSIETCKGTHGEYLRINTPHKLSLYVRAHLPIIIWSGAAMADFVVKNRIGFTIDSLADIDAKIGELSKEEYDEMRRNVNSLSQKIASGYFFKTAVGEALKQLG